LQELSDKLIEYRLELLIHLDIQIGQTIGMDVFAHNDSDFVVLSQYRLLLSELGGYILGPSQTSAGTKRLSNLLRSKKWGSKVIVDYLCLQAEYRLCKLKELGEDRLVVWDESELEKPESMAIVGLLPVHSSKADRLKRIKPRYYNPRLFDHCAWDTLDKYLVDGSF